MGHLLFFLRTSNFLTRIYLAQRLYNLEEENRHLHENIQQFMDEFQHLRSPPQGRPVSLLPFPMLQVSQTTILSPPRKRIRCVDKHPSSGPNTNPHGLQRNRTLSNLRKHHPTNWNTTSHNINAMASLPTLKPPLLIAHVHNSNHCRIPLVQAEINQNPTGRKVPTISRASKSALTIQHGKCFLQRSRSTE